MPGQKDSDEKSIAASARRDEENRSVTVGDIEFLNSTSHLAPYDSAWPSVYAQEAVRVREVLGEKVLMLEHVGST